MASAFAVGTKKRAWLWIFDFLSGALCGVWLFRHGFVPDLRRAFLGGTLLFSWICWRYRKQLLFTRIFRSAIALLATGKQWRMRLGLLFCALLVAKGVLNCLSLQYTLFDVGIFHQLLWNLSLGNGFLAPLSGAENFLRDHFVPSLAVFAPFYRVLGLGTWTLGVLPGVMAGGMLSMVFGGWWYLAEKAEWARSRKRALVSSFLLLGAWGFQTFFANLDWGFHENLVGAAAISWALAIYFVHGTWRESSVANRLPGGFWISVLLLVLAAGSKESYLLVAAFAAVALMVIENRALARQVFAALALLFVATFVWYSQSDRDPTKNYFSMYFGYLGPNLKSMVSTLLFKPKVVWNGMPLKADVSYLRELLLPFGFLPLIIALPFFRKTSTGSLRKLGGKLWLALALVPSLAAGLLSAYPGLRNPNVHYFFELIPVLGVLTVMSFAVSAPKRLHILGICFVLIAWITDWEEPWRGIIPGIRAAYSSVPIIEKLNALPANATVMPEDGAGAWISSRPRISVWGDLSALKGQCPDYFVFRADPASSTEKKVKLADVEKTLERCHSPNAHPFEVGSVGEWWIYAAFR